MADTWVECSGGTARNQGAVFFMSLIGAIVLLAIYRMFFVRRAV